MSRVGQTPIEVPDGVSVSVEGTKVRAKGAQGELTVDLPPGITAAVEGNLVRVARPDDLRESRSFHGLGRSLLANMIEGVNKGFSKELEIEGVGFRAALQGKTLVLTVGFSSPIEYQVPDGIAIDVPGGTKIKVSGPSKQLVGQVAARIRAFCPVEPYKGKGIQYKGEHVRRKVGKTVA